MIWSIVLVFAVLLGIAQAKWAGLVLRKLSVAGKADCLLAQPGEKITWYATVNNHSRFPVLFTRLQLQFPGNAAFEENEDWFRRHCRKSIHLWHVEEVLTLMPLKSCRKTSRL